MGLICHIPLLWLYEKRYPFLDIQEETLPSPLTLFKQIFIIIMVDDFMLYWSHRMFHCRHKWFPMYQTFHKQHHEFAQSVSIAATYAHPVEFAISNYYPFFAGSFLLGPKTHFTTFGIWMFLRYWETADGHSGYEFPWMVFRILPWTGDSKYHYFHHYKNRGNFCTWFKVWDTLCDTNIDFIISEEERMEKGKLISKKYD